MKKLVFNDSRWIEIQDATEAEGILHVRIILTTSEQLKAVFGDPFATQKMTCFDNQQQSAVYENYTILNYIKEYTGGIFEVEMIQENKDAETRLRALESKAKSQAEDIEQIKKDIEGGGTGVDQALITASVVVARANAQALPDVQALEAKVLYDTFDDLVKAKYTADKQGFKFRDGDDLYKTAQDNVAFQAQYRPGQGTESLYTHIDEAHAGTVDDPIPVPDSVTTSGFDYVYGKYYSEGGAVYLCQRQGIQNPESMYGQTEKLYFAPSALVGQYFVQII